MDKIVFPQLELEKYHCVHCGQFSRHKPFDMHKVELEDDDYLSIGTINECGACGELHIWLDSSFGMNDFIFPDSFPAPPPSNDLPEEVRDFYREASSIAKQSPRGAAALLRLGLQVLIQEILEDKKIGIDKGIAELVKQGLKPKIQKALDVIRVTGNDAVHPGVIDTDDIEVVSRLFPLINMIARQMITEPKQVEALFDDLPENKKEGIEQRNKKAKSDAEKDNDN